MPRPVKLNLSAVAQVQALRMQGESWKHVARAIAARGPQCDRTTLWRAFRRGGGVMQHLAACVRARASST